VYNVNLSTNGIGDPSALKELSNLMHLDLGSNKVKNVNVFTVDENFPNL
jgi:Leucine-rich repeat (LRR) protein